MPVSLLNASSLTSTLVDQCMHIVARQGLRDVAPAVLGELVTITEADTGYLLLYREADKSFLLEASSGAAFVPDEFEDAELGLYFERFTHPLKIDESGHQPIERLEALNQMLPVHANLFVPLTANGKTIGLAALAVRNEVTEAVIPHLQQLANVGASALLNSAREGILEDSFDAFCELVGRMVDSRTRSDHDHSARVGEYCAITAAQLGWHHDDIESARRAGYLHDIGKLSVPDEVLHKPGRLAPEEYALMCESTLWGASLLTTIPALQPTAEIVRHQGERFDGTGFPDGLRGDAIPIGSRVLAVCHRFAVGLTPRVDRPPFARMQQLIRALDMEKGTMLDPRIVDVFLEALGHRG